MNVSMPLGTVRNHLHDRASARPATLGQRLQDRVQNGALSKGQYRRILAEASSLAPERVQDIKEAYDRGHAGKALDLLHAFRLDTLA